MNKILLFLFILSCTFTDVRNLYEKDSDAYNSLKDAAARECVNNNAIFNNLRKTSFNDYSDILSDGNYISLDDNNNYFIYIDGVSDSGDSVTFSVIPVTSSGAPIPILNQGKYTISFSENLKVADTIAQGVCNDSYDGNPDSSSTQLTVNVTRYYIKDDTDVNSNDLPGIYEKRLDNFTLNEDIPPFLFVWMAKYQTFIKNDGEAEDNGTVNIQLSLENTNSTTCPTTLSDASKCTISNTPVLLDINELDYNQLRQTSADAINKYYYTNF